MTATQTAARIGTRPSLGRRLLRRVPLLGAAIGVVLALWLVAANDVGAVADAFGRVGLLGIFAVVLVRVAIIGLCGVAWARVLTGLVGVAAGPFVLLRFVREGVNVLLPVASVGGEVLGARLLTFWGVTGAASAAGILVDMFFQVVTQALFALTGVVLLSRLEGEQAATLAAWCAKGLALSGIVLAAFFAVQRYGGAAFIERQVSALARRFAAEGGTAPAGGGVQASLDAVWDRRRWWPLAQGSCSTSPPGSSRPGDLDRPALHRHPGGDVRRGGGARILEPGDQVRRLPGPERARGAGGRLRPPRQPVRHRSAHRARPLAGQAGAGRGAGRAGLMAWQAIEARRGLMAAKAVPPAA